MIALSDLHSAQSRIHGIAVRTRLIELPSDVWRQPPKPDLSGVKGAIRPGKARFLGALDNFA